MSIKLKAFLRTVALIASATIAGLGITLLLKYFDSDTVLMGLMVSLAAWLGYCFYQANVSMLESEARIKELNDKRI
jgi:hypothetical protein